MNLAVYQMIQVNKKFNEKSIQDELIYLTRRHILSYEKKSFLRREK